MSKKQVLLLDELAADAQAWLAGRYALDYQPALARDLTALRQYLYKADALIVPSWLAVTNQLLDFAPRLSVLGRIYHGGDNINLEACRRRGVLVVQASSTAARALAEFLLSNLLALFRSNGALHAWPHDVDEAHMGREINDSVIGLFGLSAPAQLLAPALSALGARLVGYDPALHRSDPVWQRLGVQPLSLPDLLQVADAVSLQLPFATRYQGLLGDQLLQLCKPGQLWASVSRLAFFEQRALGRALDGGRIGGIWVDNDVVNPNADDHADLLARPNVYITPRQAARTQESYLRGSWYLVDRLHEALSASPTQAMPLSLGGESVPMTLG